MGSNRIAFDMDGVLADMESELVRLAKTLFGDSMTREPLAPGAATPADNPARGDEATHEEVSSEEPPRDEAPGDEAHDDEETPPAVKWTLTSRQQRRLWEHVGSIGNFWETLSEIEPGTVKRLASIAVDRRWEVIFLTRRPETAGATAQVQSQRWLISKGFALPSVYVVQRSRGRIAAALDLDAVVDDRCENCLDVLLDSDARAILVRRDDREPLPAAATRMGVRVVTSMKECLDLLIQPAWLTGPTRPTKPAGPAAPDSDPASLMSRMMRALGFKDPIAER